MLGSIFSSFSELLDTQKLPEGQFLDWTKNSGFWPNLTFLGHLVNVTSRRLKSEVNYSYLKYGPLLASFWIYFSLFLVHC